MHAFTHGWCAIEPPAPTPAVTARVWAWRLAPASPSPCSPPPAAAVTGWVFQGVGLEARTRVISPTYPGFGASQSNNGRTFMSFGEDVKELLDHLQGEGGGPDEDCR